MRASTSFNYVSIGISIIEAATVASDVTSIGHAVRDLEKSVSFYHDVLGLQIVSRDSVPQFDPAYGQLTATKSATYRKATIEIPNQSWSLNLIQYYGLPQSPNIKQREADPATPALTLTCKNSTAVNIALRAANVSNITGDPIQWVRVQERRQRPGYMIQMDI